MVIIAQKFIHTFKTSIDWQFRECDLVLLISIFNEFNFTKSGKI